MKNLFFAAAVAAAAAGLAGCVTVGRPFDSGRVRSITLNKTTQADLKLAFGEPFRHGLDSGDLTWTYVRYQLQLLGTRNTKDLVVRFNADGTVKSYTFNTNFPEDE